MKRILLYAISVLLLLAGCMNKEFTNPVDPEHIQSNLLAPYGLQYQLSGESIRLNWTDRCNIEAGYKIDRRVNGGSWQTGYKSVGKNSTFCWDHSITQQGSYEYRVYPFRESYNGSHAQISLNMVLNTAAPSFSHLSGTYNNSFGLWIHSTTPGAQIRYTVNGPTPNASSPLYTPPYNVTQTNATIKAIAICAGRTPSTVVTHSYILKPLNPSFSLAEGTYETAQTCTLTCATAGATIHYTTNGSIPSSSSPVYGSPINFSQSTTIKAIAVKSGFSNSDVISKTYTISTTVATPVIQKLTGVYNNTFTTTISCSTANSTIRFTLDGTEPSTSSTLYTGALTISNICTLKAKAWKTGLTPSEIATASYTMRAANPNFNIAQGTYQVSVNLAIGSATTNAAIRYTTDGSNPTPSSTLYTGQINISKPTIIKAQAHYGSWEPSAMIRATYMFDEYVAGGTFNNGTGNMTLSSFYIGKTEITQALYQNIMGSNPSSGAGIGVFHPVYNVSWFKAIEFCNRLSSHFGLSPCYKYNNVEDPDLWPSGWDTNSGNHIYLSCNWNASGFRLPTEAEWHFAARGGNSSHNYTYSGSNDVAYVAYYNNNSLNSTWDVASKPVNEVDTHLMSGNVREWCWDIYAAYPTGSYTNYTGATSGSSRCYRGGGYSDTPSLCTVIYRSSITPTTNAFMGFRVARKY